MLVDREKIPILRKNKKMNKKAVIKEHETAKYLFPQHSYAMEGE